MQVTASRRRSPSFAGTGVRGQGTMRFVVQSGALVWTLCFRVLVETSHCDARIRISRRGVKGIEQYGSVKGEIMTYSR